MTRCSKLRPGAVLPGSACGPCTILVATSVSKRGGFSASAASGREQVMALADHRMRQGRVGEKKAAKRDAARSLRRLHFNSCGVGLVCHDYVQRDSRA